ncbi:MAG: hypothetical protein HY729_08865, partial [Candidatus Rokubacteria bacterium]|nr:hypothetical protein [Candidatus Rokubacteria bacterium]
MGGVRPDGPVPLTAGRGATWGRIGRGLAVGVLISIAVTAVSRSGALAGWETRAVDAFLFLRDRQPAPEIVVVAIDDDAFRE